MKNHGYIFVYGTLKEGGYFSKKFDSRRKKSTKAKVKGTLYNMGAYPGAVLGGGKTICGELHLYSDFAKVVKAMDRIEGHHGKNNEHNLYNKNAIKVKAGDKTRKAIIYTLNTTRISLKDREIQENGVWPID